MRPYLRVLRTPGLRVPLIATVLGALPLGMFGLGLVLFVHARTGSLGEAGLGAGAFGVGNAVGLTVQGWLADRFGPAVVLVSAGVACAVWTVLLVVVVPPAGVLVAAAGAGIAVPATTGSMRVLVGELVEEGDRAAGYALLAVLFQLALLAGPLVTSLLLAPAGPGGAVLVAGGLACAAGVLFAATGASRAQRRVRRGVRGRSRSGASGALLLIAAGAGISAGLVSVAVPAAALARGGAAGSGPLIAVSSAGEIVGGLVYGARRGSAERQLPLILAGSAAAAGLTAVLAGRLTWLFTAMFLTGICAGPFAIATSRLVAPRQGPYSLMVGLGLLGGSVGSGVGGAIVDALGYRAGFIANAGWLACLLAGVVAGDSRRNG